MEILVTILVLFVLVVLAFVAERIVGKIKWNPFEKSYNESISEDSKTFSMINEPNTATVCWFGFGAFAFFFVGGIIVSIALILTNQVKLWEGVLVFDIFSVFCVPFSLVCLHLATKKIFVTEEYIFVKSLVLKKQYNIKEIINVKEISRKQNQFVTIKTLEIIFNDKKLKVRNCYSNYELLKSLILKEN